MHFAVTLVERDYIYGACILYNSLIRNGFNGHFVIGYRNRPSLPDIPFHTLEHHGSNLHLIELDTPVHFANLKPSFMLQVLDMYPQCRSISYFDPDIVVDAPCNWILNWCDGGPAACADVNWWMSSSHPTRREWANILGFKACNQLDMYFNSGFLSLHRADWHFLQLWQQIISQIGELDIPLDAKGEIGDWRDGVRWLPFMAIDQDALNIALMTWHGSITTLGPDVMGFSGVAFIPHAIGTPKPWQKHYIYDSLRGMPPRTVDKLFWKYANGPLLSYKARTLILKSCAIKIASFIGRFLKRS